MIDTTAAPDADLHTRNLVIVHTPGRQALSDWVTVKAKINARAPDIDVRIVPNQMPRPEITEWQLSRASLVFSACPLMFKPVGRGKIYAGGPMDKLAENRRLADCGIPTPPMMLLTPGLSLDPGVWGEYVLVKPASLVGMRGRGIVLARADSVGSRFAELTANGRLRMVVQKLIDATDDAGRLGAYRALTMFGRPLYVFLSRHVNPRPPLAEIHDSGSNAIAHNAAIKGLRREREFVDHADVLDLAGRAANAMEEFPVLGIDVIRDRPTGELFVLETNPTGAVWHLSSELGLKFPHKFRRRMYNQFGALDIATDALIDKTREKASLWPAGSGGGATSKASAR
jgi:hypothetical protein